MFLSPAVIMNFPYIFFSDHSIPSKSDLPLKETHDRQWPKQPCTLRYQNAFSKTLIFLTGNYVLTLFFIHF